MSEPAGRPGEPWSREEKNALLLIASILANGEADCQLRRDRKRTFSWDTTPQGAVYWSQVVQNLRTIAREPIT